MGHSNGKVQFSTYLPVDLHRGLKVAAAVLGVPVATIIEDLLVEHLDAYVAKKQAEKKSADPAK